jgi:hypothetical protein
MTIITGQPQSPAVAHKVTAALAQLHQPKPARAIHYLQTPTDRFRAIASNRMNFETALNNRDYQEKDILVLQEIPTNTTNTEFYITSIKHVLEPKCFTNGIVPGWCALSFGDAIAYFSYKKAP